MVDRTYPRLLGPTLLDRLGRSPVVVLIGPRQAGKTTLVRSLAGARERRFETLDALLTLDRARREPEALIEGAAPVTIDEVQRAPELLLAVKRSVDDRRTKGQFLLTGSANLLLMKGVGDSLAGRAIYLTLRPMTEREKRGDASAPPWTALMTARGPAAALGLLPGRRPFAWRQAVLEGGLPPAALAADAVDRRVWLDAYVDTYAQRDLRDLAQVGDVAAFVRVMKLAALRTGGLVNHADLARDADLPRTTVQRWLSILETSLLITRLDAYALSRTKRLIKAPKLYFTDCGLALRLCGVDSQEALDREPRHGVWLENLVLNDLLAWGETELSRPLISHWRSASGEEVDLVVERGKRLLPIEVKASRSVRVEDARVVDSLCAELGSERAPFGLVLYDGLEAIRLTKAAIAVPIGQVL